MQINEMLEYQKLDGEIRKLENDVKNSEDRKNATKMQDYLKDCQNKTFDNAFVKNDFFGGQVQVSTVC